MIIFVGIAQFFNFMFPLFLFEFQQSPEKKKKNCKDTVDWLFEPSRLFFFIDPMFLIGKEKNCIFVIYKKRWKTAKTKLLVRGHKCAVIAWRKSQKDISKDMNQSVRLHASRCQWDIASQRTKTSLTNVSADTKVADRESFIILKNIIRAEQRQMRWLSHLSVKATAIT